MDQSGNASLLPSFTPATCPQETPDPLGSGDSQIGAVTNIRVYRDGQLIACCKARSIAPARLFAGIDPLPNPVTTRLEIEFVSANSSATGLSRLSATVVQRSTSGVVLSISPGIASTRDHPK